MFVNIHWEGREQQRTGIQQSKFFFVIWFMQNCRVLSREGAASTREAGSCLITALCKSAQTEKALAVYEDMVVATTRIATASQPPPPPTPLPAPDPASPPSAAEAALFAHPSATKTGKRFPCVALAGSPFRMHSEYCF
jgi:pentatricopeptide repeat protein